MDYMVVPKKILCMDQWIITHIKGVFGLVFQSQKYFLKKKKKQKDFWQNGFF